MRFLRAVFQRSQTLLEACLPSHCLLCNLTSQQSLICQYCYDAILAERTYCLHCGCGLITTQNYCGECLQHQFEFQQLHALASYQAPFPQLIKKLKYQNQLLYADLLGLLLADSIKQRFNEQQLQKIDYIIPVPLHIKKLRTRGFNQTQLISEALSQHLSINIAQQMVIRNKFTQAQEGLSRSQRTKNLNNAFSLSEKGRVTLAGKHIVLIDDVVTTGATINSLCQCLLAANVKRVDVWCICRTELN
ncbi:ComF family protein [Psychromonas sp.]|nr:ComF family protein [Psychromonas sp.]